jgi:hypothetical protein
VTQRGWHRSSTPRRRTCSTLLSFADTSLFPRYWRRGRPRLSWLDEELLRPAQEGWIRVARVVGNLIGTQIDGVELGDLVLFHRYEAWSRAGVVELHTRREDDSEPRFVAVARGELRLTKNGERLLREGWSDADAVPTFEVGGALAYAPGGWMLTPGGFRR